ncbi:5-methyltetrahydropteroyltriglutamate-homocysteine S-methyltransferase [Jimgerdemannia flammicorona]|uniref:5-methyltetrahydropteroyltriglutamate--homocysteine S-methyltransferase n=2 Tax=Jimgerdemannia flammicorona TaxID=994334 RepID=A0A433QMG0_9FUNG|nr:5-methyltetrahydropteroyltriglutamate-homocysteine S-methyltransferase [Jimgerdemannia flammicorona]
MVIATNLGFPYVGPHRELKKLVESFWASKSSKSDLLAGARQLRENHWRVQKEQGIDQVPVGDFTLYDRVLDTACNFGVVPKRYHDIPDRLEQYFAMGRGLQKSATDTSPKIDVPAMEMKKWFDTNYHFIVPEFEQHQKFTLQEVSVVNDFIEAKALGFTPRPVVLGPVSFLYLGKAVKASEPFEPIALLDRLLPVYVDLLGRLSAAGAEWIQIDEPVLVLDLLDNLRLAYEVAYTTLRQANIKILLASYFGPLGTNVDLVKNHIDGLHVDLVRDPNQLDSICAALGPHQYISLGLVDGRNVWKNNLHKSIALAQSAVNILGTDRVFVAPSCSLIHSPYSTQLEKGIRDDNPELFEWLSFAVEKCAEISIITRAITSGQDFVREALERNALAVETRRTSSQTVNKEIRRRLDTISPNDYKRVSPFPTRREQQAAKLRLPSFPTTTIGSFPQTKEIRVARAKFAKGLISPQSYDTFIKSEIERVIRFQERAELDVLVHGEPERNDMVEHFGHLLHGYGFTEHGWVVSYGSRCVKPPLIYGDVSRRAPMTVTESAYSQSLTTRPVKGMLTGPVTMMKWSFVRDDVEPRVLCTQIALALRDEVVDLEAAGIAVIQVDEPAIREGLPLRRQDWAAYLEWSVGCFRLSTSGVRDDTQIHTHMCYSDFNDIFDAIQDLDADVITIENSKSEAKLLSIFEHKRYTNEIGPGLYDIHSPRVPSVEEMASRLEEMLRYIPKHLIWVNPDCGLKSRAWPEVEAALLNMVKVAKQFRTHEETVVA